MCPECQKPTPLSLERQVAKRVGRVQDFRGGVFEVDPQWLAVTGNMLIYPPPKKNNTVGKHMEAPCKKNSYKKRTFESTDSTFKKVWELICILLWN